MMHAPDEAPDDGATPPWRHGEADELSLIMREVLALAALARPAMARQLGLSLTEIWALEHVLDGPMGPVELSRRLSITSAASTVLARRLEDAGHLSRTPHPNDGRRTMLRVTPTALGRMFEVLGPLIADLEAVGAELDEHDRQVVIAYLTRVVGALTAVDRPDNSESEAHRPAG